jgi:hypothetical protein
MKTVLVMVFLLAGVPAVQNQTPKPLGVSIEGWRYEPQAKVVILHLVNNSHKDVTAFNISIAEKYADGTTNYVDGRAPGIHDHQMMEDLLGHLINAQLRKSTEATVPEAAGGNAYEKIMHQQMIQNLQVTFAAGTSRDQIDFVTKDVSDIDAIVDVVAYADGTAQVVDNDRAFKNLVAERKGPVLAMEKMIEVVKGVLADPMVTSPFDAALRQLIPLAESANVKNGSPEDPEHEAAVHLRMEVQDFQSMQRSLRSRITMTEREWLTQYVQSQEKLIELMKPHCELAVEK